VAGVYKTEFAKYRDKIGVFYANYATENTVSYTEAIKALTIPEQKALIRAVDAQLRVVKGDAGYLAYLKNLRKQ
jgi:hypothetical protein